jgi:uncharacterized protein (TIGR00725 family)
MRPALSKQTVGVMGSGTVEHDESACLVGRLLAELEVNLLTGGGGGVMRAVSRAFVQHRRDRGICIGIIPCASRTDRMTPKPGYPNEFVELAIHTHLPYSGRHGTHDLSRNHINVLSCAAIVALPGGDGTAAEVSLAVRYGKPVVAFSENPVLVRHFPESVQRIDCIDDVKRFLCEHLECVA